jgi:hypothetical protein
MGASQSAAWGWPRSRRGRGAAGRYRIAMRELPLRVITFPSSCTLQAPRLSAAASSLRARSPTHPCRLWSPVLLRAAACFPNLRSRRLHLPTQLRADLAAGNERGLAPRGLVACPMVLSSAPPHASCAALRFPVREQQCSHRGDCSPEGRPSRSGNRGARTRSVRTCLRAPSVKRPLTRTSRSSRRRSRRRRSPPAWSSDHRSDSRSPS